MGPLWIANIIISLAIVIALLYVLKTYLAARQVVNSRLTNALILFTIIFILQNTFAVYTYYLMAEEYSTEIANHMLILNFMGLLGFSLFAYVARH